MVVFLSVAVIAFGISCVVSYLLSRPTSPVRIIDHPNERSLHIVPLPRTGGLAIWFGGLAAIAAVLVAFGTRPELAWIGAAALVVGIVSLIDDMSNIPVAVRLVAQAAAAGLLLAGGLGLETIGPFGFGHALTTAGMPLLSLVFVVWAINLYNFMDGMDGFAGGMAVLGFGTFGVLGYMAGHEVFAGVSWAVAAAAGGFLVWNFPPARIFMGDTGASTLGAMVGAMSLWADRTGIFPLWISILVFSPFVVDATVTLVGRIMRRERFWEAHRKHYYQRLVQLGWGHKKTVLVEYLLMVGCGMTAIALAKAPAAVQWLGICVWGFVYVFGVLAVAKLDARAR